MAPTWTVRRQISPTATATAVGTRPTSCWCAGRWRGPTATRRWGRCHRRCLLRMGMYARVSTSRQAQAQTIEQQLERLRAAVGERGWVLDAERVYRDDGYRGATLSRPGLDRLRDHAALADLDVVVVTAPDRLARNDVHQVLLVDELGRHGCRVEFLDRPMSADPHDQLLLGDPRGGGRVRTHPDRRADAPRAAGQAAGGHAAAVDPGAVRLPGGPAAARRGGRGAGRARRGSAGRAAVRLVFGTGGDAVPAGQAADRSGDCDPDGQAALERGGACAASCAAQPGLCGPSADQPHAGGAGQDAQVGAAAGRPGGKPCAPPAGGVDRGAGPPDRERGDLRPGAGQAGHQPAGRRAQHPPPLPAAGAGQLWGLPPVVHRPHDPKRLQLLHLRGPHRCAAARPGAALHRPLRPRRTAGRAGLG
jgi:hypothetical protein